MSQNVITSKVDILEVIPNFLSKYLYLFKPIPSSTPSNLKDLTEKLVQHYKNSRSFSNFKTISSLDDYMKHIRSYLDSININYKIVERNYSSGLFKLKVNLVTNIDEFPRNYKPTISVVKPSTEIKENISDKVDQEYSKLSSDLLSSLNTHITKTLHKISSSFPDDFDFIASTYWYKLRVSAKSRNIPFSLTLPHLKKLMKTKKCFYLGTELTAEDFTVDRVEFTEGYTNKNTVACSNTANKLKNICIENLSVPTVFLERIIFARQKGLMKEPEEASIFSLKNRQTKQGK